MAKAESRSIKEWIYHFSGTGIISKYQKDEMIRQIQQAFSNEPEPDSRTTYVPPNSTASREPFSFTEFIHKYSKLILGLIAVSLVGFALVYLVASNWTQFGPEIRLIFIGLIILVSVLISWYALKRDTAGWLEGTALLNFFVILAVSALISQTFHTQSEMKVFLTMLLPACVMLTYAFASRVLWSITSLLFIVTSVANDYRYWYVILVWVSLETIRLFKSWEKEPFGLKILSIGLTNILLVYGVAYSFRESVVLVMSLLCIIALLYDRLYVCKGVRANPYRYIGVSMFLLTVGPIYSLGFGEISTLYVITLFIALAGYIYVTVKSTAGRTCKRGFWVNQWYFPLTAVMPVAVCLGTVFTLVHPLIGALVSLLLVISAYIYAGNYYDYKKYTSFGICIVLYLTAVIAFLTDGAFITRSIFAGVTGFVLLALILGVHKYGSKQKG